MTGNQELEGRGEWIVNIFEIFEIHYIQMSNSHRLQNIIFGKELYNDIKTSIVQSLKSYRNNV